MDQLLIKDYLRRAEMNDAQSEALSRIFAEMATKSDLRVLDERLTGQMAELRTDLTGQMAQLRTDLTGQMAQLRTDLTGQMAGHKAELSGEVQRQIAHQTRWMIALIVLFGSVITILNALIGLAR